MSLETHSRIVRALAERGYNAEREAVTLLAGATDPEAAVAAVVESTPDDALRITADRVRRALDTDPPVPDPGGVDDPASTASDSAATEDRASGASKTSVSTPEKNDENPTTELGGAVEMEGSSGEPKGSSESESVGSGSAGPASTAVQNSRAASASASTGDSVDRSPQPADISGDITGRSTGTGEYGQFVTTFRDRYERLSKLLGGRVNHRPATAIDAMPGGSDAEMIGLVNDIRSTASGHWLIELEDTTGTFPALVMKDRDIAELVDDLLLDECIAVQGTLADDGGIIFVDSLFFPEVPRTFRPSTADRHVQAALVSDVHVGSQEFMADAWNRFADWLHTEEAEHVEYLLIAGDMVEGVGVYPDQDEELDIVDIFEQYEAFSEHLKAVPGDMEIVMIPGNHDAVRLAEPQPGFDEELRSIMSAHDARITGNPSTVTIEGVSVLMYHGVSLDEVIAELPADKASYDEPHKAMYQLLKKRHVAPKYGGKMRLAPEEKDYLVIDEVPDVFHTGHVHKLGWGKYHNVLAVNSGCWQAQTAFQKKVNIDPDVAHAPIVDLDTLNMTVRKFA
ncbi:MAG: DNA-directed DNA polymerase II small subunit [Halohasta sp.]